MKINMQSFTDAKNKSLGTVTLQDSVFGTTPNAGVVHQVITTYQTRA